MGRVNRRGFLLGLGGAVLGCGFVRGEEEVGSYRWSGIGFGIEMGMELYGVDEVLGKKLGVKVEALVKELEGCFSLWLEDSELSRLNRERVLVKPSGRFLEVLGLARKLSLRSLGYFQPGVHGAWEWAMANPELAIKGKSKVWRKLVEGSKMDGVLVEGGEVRLRESVKLSFNAYLQGYLADEVAKILRVAGVKSGLLQMGENYGIGRHPEGREWKLGVSGGEDLLGFVEFSDAGMAVSKMDGKRLLVDPVAGVVRKIERVVAVVSVEGASVADVFATAFCVAPIEARKGLVAGLGAKGKVRIWEEGELVFRVE